MTYYLKGDCHGDFSWLKFWRTINPDEYAAFILLGDAGLNFYLNKTDQRTKSIIVNCDVKVYCVHGNHEARPQSLNYERKFIEEVGNYCYVDSYAPNNIFYLEDGLVYHFGGYKCLVLGGAYSVDKWYRILRAGYTEEHNDPKATGWWADEQISPERRSQILGNCSGLKVDFILSHTCPLRYEPDDLFLSMIDQSKVDKSMEKWLDEVVDRVDWFIWCFGHYHADRVEAPYVEQFYRDNATIDSTYKRWVEYMTTGDIDWIIDGRPGWKDRGGKRG